MKKMKSLMMMAAIAAASFTFTSCDDDPYWHDHYGWYEDYNHGGWGWNQGDWNHGSQGSQDDDLLAEAQTLVGDWYGKVQLSELAEDGNSRNNYEFYANMIFYQSDGKSNSLSGNGVEIDYATDDSGDTQTLKFTWYIDNNGDIYIKYASGTTYVMDAGASQYGFHLGEEKGKPNDTFYGYMIGTGTAKGDIMYIDLERNTSSTAAAKGRAARTDTAAVSTTAVFGGAKGRTSMAGTVKKLPSRR